MTTIFGTMEGETPLVILHRDSGFHGRFDRVPGPGRPQPEWAATVAA